ncbi:MAG: putative DNA binding domain-containing protein [Nitrospinae bacterium]|nr:putative DNA binding domain-containing protein [Nitrospinota bacterium]
MNATDILHSLLGAGRETEIVEFKEARTKYDFDKLGEYYSALANEANLRGKDRAWFIIGVADDGTVVGTEYGLAPGILDKVKNDLSQSLSPRQAFREIHEIQMEGKRVLLFEITAAPRGVPLAWRGHYYGRRGSSIGALDLEKFEAIRGQAVYADWSQESCEGASLDDLDPEALLKARTQYEIKNPRLSEELRTWDDAEFLRKAGLLIKEKLTRAAIVLLGRKEAERLLSPSVATISWILKGARGTEEDYQHFGPPWILNSEEAFWKIRNIRFRHMPDGSLFPLEIDKYDAWVVREALHNAIAHQDYSLCSRIALVEFPDRIVISNAGSFIPASVESVIERDAPESRYRNDHLCKAMVSLNMIDTIGSGIKKMFRIQRDRLFPLPDYHIGDKQVAVSILGHILDPHYVQQLTRISDLPLGDVILLDKVQKGIRIEKDDAKRLKSMGLIEGSYPRVHISSSVATISNQKARYLHNRGLDVEHYFHLVQEHIRHFGSITRKEADELLLPKLPDILDDHQKQSKIHNILTSMVRQNLIENRGSRRYSRYHFAQNSHS